MEKILTLGSISTSPTEGVVYTNPEGRLVLVSPDRESVEVVANDSQAYEFLGWVSEAVKILAKRESRTSEATLKRLYEESGRMAIPKLVIDMRRDIEDERILRL